MPTRWHKRLILEDKQDTGQIFYARKLQILDRIGAHMTTLCVRPCLETLALKFNRDGARAGRMPKRWHTRLILEDHKDTGQIFYGRKIQILNRIGTHMTTWCGRPYQETLPLKLNRDGARRQNAKKVAHTQD